MVCTFVCVFTENVVGILDSHVCQAKWLHLEKEEKVKNNESVYHISRE